MDTSELINRVRESILEFGQTPFSDKLILNRLNHFGELAYNYMASSVEDYTEELEIPVEASGDGQVQEVRVPARIHNYRIDKVYYWLDSVKVWQELPRLNLMNFYEKQQLDATYSLPEYYTTRRDILLVSPTTGNYKLKVLYTPKYLPLSINAGIITYVGGDLVQLDTVPEELVANSSSHWNVFTIAGINGNVKGIWQYTNDGSSYVQLQPNVLGEYQGFDVVPYSNADITSEVSRTNAYDNRLKIRLGVVPSEWVTGEHLELDGIQGGSYVSSFLYETYLSDLEGALEGSWPYVTPDIQIPSYPPTVYQITAIDRELGDVTLEPVGNTDADTYPRIFRNGYYNMIPRNPGTQRFILEGATEVEIVGADGVTTLVDQYTVELSAAGFETQRFQATRISEDGWFIAAILPSGYSGLDSMVPNYYAHALEAPRYTNVAILDPDDLEGTPLFTGGLTYADGHPTSGSVLLAVDANGVTMEHQFTSAEHEEDGFPLETIRITLTDSHSTGSPQESIVYTHAQVTDAERLQLGVLLPACYGSAFVQNVAEGSDNTVAFLERRRWAAEFPMVGHTRVHYKSFNSRYFDQLADTATAQLAEPIIAGDVVCYGVGVPTDSFLGDVSTYLVEATSLSLKNSLHEGTELLFESLRSHWTAVRAYGSMGKRTDTKLVRSRVQLKTRRGRR